MSERSTPDEIEQMCEGRDPDVYVLLDELAAHGYRIVHPDDVPEGDWIDWPADRKYGWNLCRRLIFGDER